MENLFSTACNTLSGLELPADGHGLSNHAVVFQTLNHSTIEASDYPLCIYFISRFLALYISSTLMTVT